MLKMALSKANTYRMALNKYQKATYLTINAHIVKAHISNISRDPSTNMPTNNTEIQSTINKFRNTLAYRLKNSIPMTGDPMLSTMLLTENGITTMKTICNRDDAMVGLYADMCMFMKQCSFDNKDDTLLDTPKGVIKRVGKNGSDKLEIFRQPDKKIVIRYKYEYEDYENKPKEQWIRLVLRGNTGARKSGVGCRVERIVDDVSSPQCRGTLVSYFAEL